jgi:L-fucose mutarotase/ribose pyranase (RbsD/FucU family)
MSIQAQKLNLIERLLLLQDESIIKKIEKMLEVSVKKSKADLKPMSMEEFYARVEQAEAAIKEGKTISQADLENEAANW